MKKHMGMMGLSLLALAGCGAQDLEGSPPEAQGSRVEETSLARPVQSAAELQRMQQYLNERYSPQDVVHRFRSALGDNIDCVRMEAQPGMRRAGMERHVIQLAPSTLPQGAPVDSFGARGLNPRQGLTDALDETGAVQHCPDGSIPILRTGLEDLQRFSTLDEFFRKTPAGIDPRPSDAQSVSPLATGPSSGHQYAHAALYSRDNHGSTSTLNIWSTAVELDSEFSLSQIWVTRGSGTGLQTLEVGSQVYKGLYGDKTPHLFIYSTQDGYSKTGCYNLTCSNFVQTDKSVVIGGSLGAGSVTGGTQYESRMEWFKDGATGPWWLRIGTTWVGYYPVSLYNANGVADHANNIDFGGEIIDGRSGGRHTATDMGSGGYPSGGWQKAAYQRLIQYTDLNNTYQTPTLTGYRDFAGCYDIALFNDTSANGWGQYFYFGGPGYNANCT